jgi:translocator protein
MNKNLASLRFEVRNSVFFLLTLVTILINGLAVGLPINGISTAEVSNKFFTLLTPAGFTFSIWSVIYLGLLVIGVLIALEKINLTKKGFWLYLSATLVNCAWIFAWHYTLILIAGILLLALAILNYLVFREFRRQTVNLVRNLVTSLYLIYLGWSVVATIINFTILFQYLVPIDAGANAGNIAVIVVMVATFLNLLFSYFIKNPTTSIVLIWALNGIRSAQSTLILDTTIWIAMLILALDSVMIIGLQFIPKKPKKIA